MRRLLLCIIIGVAFFAGSLTQRQSPKPILAQDVSAPDSVCIGEALTDYMNTVVDAVRSAGVSKVRLLSPVFNLTAPDGHDPLIFETMVQRGAKFDQLDGFGGNTYTTYQGDRGTVLQRLAYDHYNMGGWKQRFDSRNKPVVFTEYGEKNYDYAIGGTRPPLDRMRSEFQRASGDLNVIGVNYFSAIQGSNGEFTHHELTSAEFADITQGNDEAGVNSASFLDSNATEGFPKKVRDYTSTAGWDVEIIDGHTASTVARVVKNANARGITPVMRACIGASCSYADPLDYIDFILSLESQLSPTNEVWVVVGPNEPGIESWAAPDCDYANAGRKFEWQYLQCEDIQDPEFHSLRPYPANACIKQSPAAWLCANAMIARENFEVRADTLSGNNVEKTCDPVAADGSQTCSFTIRSAVTTKIDVANAKFPIMGNTELVPNSVSQTNRMPNAQRVNEYVSWYLNGALFRAEEDNPFIPNFVTEDGRTRLAIRNVKDFINFTGPLRKLLPDQVQRTLRLEQVDDAQASRSNVADIRHDQIVACQDDNLFSAGRGPQKPCYPETPTRRRLTNFSGNDAPPMESGYQTFLDFWQRYNEWRGRECAIVTIPVINYRFLYCTNLSALNFGPTLYPFMPFSSTEDLVGKITAGPMGFSGLGGVDISDIVYEPISDNDNLYFSHMEEDVQLASFLQNTYKPKSEPGDQGTFDLNEWYLQAGWFCDPVETRTNPGDDLYGEVDDPDLPDPVAGTVRYTAKFTCTFPPSELDQPCYDTCIVDGIKTPEQCEADCRKNEICRQTAYVVMNVNVGTPKAEEAWNRLVNGTQSIFRRIFPKIGENAPIEEIEHIPGVSKASYSSDNAIGGSVLDGGGTNVRESGDTIAGDPASYRSGADGQIFFPYIGSIHEYFLKKIQQALRPKGFESLNQGETSDASCQEVTADELTSMLPAVEPSCSYNCSNFSFPSPTFRRIIESAASFYKVPTSMLLGIFYNEGGLNPIGCQGLGCTWTEEAVLAASGPNCQVSSCATSSTGAKGPWQILQSFWPTFSNAVTSAGINDGRTPNPCNLLDSTFAAAKILSIARGGAASYNPPYDPLPMCHGVAYNTAQGPSTSCNWTDSDFMTASRQYSGFCDDCANPNPVYGCTPACQGNTNACHEMSVFRWAKCIVP